MRIGENKGKPFFWKSLTTGNMYCYFKYCNHGKTVDYREFKDLPKSEYPYTLVYLRKKVSKIFG